MISGSIKGSKNGKIFNGKASKELKDKVILSLEAAGIMVAGQAKALCPVKTGLLRSSIFHKIRGLVAYVGTNVKYAIFVEFGTRFMGARSFLRAAIDRLKNQIIKLFRKAIREVIGGK